MHAAQRSASLSAIGVNVLAQLEVTLNVRAERPRGISARSHEAAPFWANPARSTRYAIGLGAGYTFQF